MKYIKTYESEYQRDKYREYENIPYQTFSLTELSKDCKKYDIEKLIREVSMM